MWVGLVCVIERLIKPIVHDNFCQIESGSVLGFLINWRSLFGYEQKHASNWIFLSREKVPLLEKYLI